VTGELGKQITVVLTEPHLFRDEFRGIIQQNKWINISGGGYPGKRTRMSVAQGQSFCKGVPRMTILFTAIATSSGNHAYIFLAVGFVVGLIMFLVGFRTYREYRILTDTPIAPVRSIPMGLVHVHGKATGEAPMASPLTGVSCYYYRVQIEKYVKKENESSWETVRTDTGERKFYLDDATGRVLVNPQSAEYEVPQTFRAETGMQSIRSRHIDPSLGVSGPSDQDLITYLTDNSKARAALESSNIPGAKVIGKALAMEQALESAGAGVSFGGGGVSFNIGGSQSYRFTEHCLLAERDCNIIGTCSENPSPKDEHDRNLILKGQNEKTFLITSKSEEQIEKSLRWKAFALILLGAALMVGVVAAALYTSGML
jgi:Ca2+/Na+ antiporter